jgi:hypothetical protein
VILASFTVPRADRAGDAHPLYSGPMETRQGRRFAIFQRVMPTTGIVPISCSAAREGVVELPADSKRISKLSVARARQVARRKQVLEHVALGHGSVVELPADSKRPSNLSGARAYQVARRKEVLAHVALGHGNRVVVRRKSPPLVGITSLPVASLLSAVTAATPPISIGAVGPPSSGVEVEVTVVKEGFWLCHACTYEQECVPGSGTCAMCNTARRRLRVAPPIFFGGRKPPIVRPGGRGKSYCPNCRLADRCKACRLARREKCVNDLWGDAAPNNGPLK